MKNIDVKLIDHPFQDFFKEAIPKMSDKFWDLYLPAFSGAILSALVATALGFLFGYLTIILSNKKNKNELKENLLNLLKTDIDTKNLNKKSEHLEGGYFSLHDKDLIDEILKNGILDLKKDKELYLHLLSLRGYIANYNIVVLSYNNAFALNIYDEALWRGITDYLDQIAEDYEKVRSVLK